MMDRRAFLTTVGVGIAAAPLAGEAQKAGKPVRIGLLIPQSREPSAPFGEAFRSGRDSVIWVGKRDETSSSRPASLTKDSSDFRRSEKNSSTRA